MKLARYLHGSVVIEDAPEPALPPGGLLIQTEACGLCSGELVPWYMDRKEGGHVLGHEVAGRVIASEDARFPVGTRVAPHHHAACGHCSFCATGRAVHCPQWRSTRLTPGGMAERFAVAAENLTDTVICNDLRPRDAALIEPLACVVKSLRLAGPQRPEGQAAVIGLGFMGLLHLALLRAEGIEATGYDLNPARIAWAQREGFRADQSPKNPLRGSDLVIVLPGNQGAADLAFALAAPEATLVLFAPMPPGEPLRVPEEAYFLDLRIVHSYSCGPAEMQEAARRLRAGEVRAEEVVERFTDLSELPNAYNEMRQGDILKAMVEF